MNVNQIYIANGRVFSPEIEKFFQEEMDTFKNIPNSNYKLWTEKDIKDLLLDVYGTRTLLAFEKIKANTFKACLAKVAILSNVGGIYADLGNEMIDYDYFKGLTDKHELVIFADQKDPEFLDIANYDGSIQNALMYAAGKNTFFDELLPEIVENVEKSFYGTSPWDPISVVRYGKVFKRTRNSVNYVMGSFEKDSTGRCVYYMNDISKPLVGYKRLNKLDFFHKNGNSYAEIWLNRNLYG